MIGPYRCRENSAAKLFAPRLAGAVLLFISAGFSPVDAAAQPLVSYPDTRVVARLQEWAVSWSDKNIEAYLDSYSVQFKTVDGMPLDEWRQQRRQRILAPKELVIELREFTVTHSTDESISVEFLQEYRSDVHWDLVLKEVVLVHVENGWLFRSERILKVIKTKPHEVVTKPQAGSWEQAQGQFRTYGLTLPGQSGVEVEEEAYPLSLKGFWDNRIGARIKKDPNEKSLSIAETRLQLEFEKPWQDANGKLVVDVLYDYALDEHEIHVASGRGWLDLREANITISPLEFLDEKVGRQVITWGTGDLIFINDLFPKDWKAFFIGRDVAYLKAPSDAFKFSAFFDSVNVDFVYTPQFDPDRYIDGRRISFFDPVAGQRTGRSERVKADQPDAWFKDDELALRVYQTINSLELAAYGYDGFWKSPGGTDPDTGKATFPALSVLGASARGVLGKGLANVEVGYYDSRDDSSGKDPFIRNSEFRALVGYEREVAKEFTVSLQYYLERMQDHKRYLDSLPAGIEAVDKNRSVITTRLTRFLYHQNLQLSLFSFYSPSDQDWYLRPRASYKVDDSWLVEAGGNIFYGKHDHTFFNQFEKNSNLYGSVRFSF